MVFDHRFLLISTIVFYILFSMFGKSTIVQIDFMVPTPIITLETIMSICMIVEFSNVDYLTSNGKVEILRRNLTSKCHVEKNLGTYLS